jgi:hypothetical protein
MRVVPLVLIALTGCSAMTMPSAHSIRTSWVPCTSSRAAPGADGLGAMIGAAAALGGLVTFVANATADDYYADDDESHAIMAVGGAGVALAGGSVLLAYGASYRHGTRSADACAARPSRR